MFARKKLLLPGLITLLAFLVSGLYWQAPVQASTSNPTVVTNSASSIGEDYATLNAEIDSDGGDYITEYGFYYGTTSSCTKKKKVGSSIDEGDSFSYQLTGLADDTTYYFKAYVENDNGVGYGSVEYFTTEEDEDSEAPEVTTNSASDIDNESATLNGEIDWVGGSDIEEYGFYYGTTSSCSNKKKVGTDDLYEGEEFSYTLSGLDSGTKYYYQAYAKNDEGTGYGNVKYFTTEEDEDSEAPEVTTNSASDIDNESATLNGEIDWVGGSDIEEYGFYYGTTSSCSNKKRVGTDELDEGEEFSYTLSGLDSGTKYYYQAYAKNDDGTGYGSVKNFTTYDEEDVPSVTTETPSTGEGYATLYGVVTSSGYSDIESYGFYYGTSSSPGTKVEVGDNSIDEDETFSYKLTGLSPGTIYYVKAYATNDEGTSYGSVLSFTVSSASTAENPSIFTIGSASYSIKGISQTGDVAPYIKDDRTFLPIRPVAYALGIADSDILWDSATRQVTLTKGSKVVRLTINSRIMFSNDTPVVMDTSPVITNGRTCLPIALVAQAFGATATWDAATQRVTIQSS